MKKRRIICYFVNEKLKKNNDNTTLYLRIRRFSEFVVLPEEFLITSTISQ